VAAPGGAGAIAAPGAQPDLELVDQVLCDRLPGVQATPEPCSTRSGTPDPTLRTARVVPSADRIVVCTMSSLPAETSVGTRIFPSPTTRPGASSVSPGIRQPW